MSETADTADVIVHPPVAWGVAIVAAFVLDWLAPLSPLPLYRPAGWIGAALFVLAIALGVSAVITMTRAGSNVHTNRPTKVIVEHGPYRWTRNPIYLGMFLGQVGLAIAFNSIWLLITLVPLALVIRYGVVAREERYLTRRFGDVYRGYCSRIRRWL